ncbi:hypothetical protein [Owenweeksia hongkongensis]|uniref:DUF4199 domain-containing protein n=1 Tax=Owenweeksia hongkongensis (strain DSM 17368 / CIP 108786 / JCM 12287 / NRRL B-23963 / UST20020801) TaxID=926562 RepID=G8R254_OWEHD|nr:hypothetical protein [Owenweeksia hongkongensis]AEV31804.1 hypothetical protein Oweho_0791 [Owenweeksia hongkongensis DSM 17368]
MSTFDRITRTIPTKNGLFMLGGLIAYFLLMRVVGLAEVYWLRTFNLVILILFVRNSILSFRRQSSESYQSFNTMFMISVRTCFVGIGLFALFLAIYLDQIDKTFMANLAVKESFGGEITAVSAASIVFIEGMISGLAASFVLIQLFKSKTIEAKA